MNTWKKWVTRTLVALLCYTLACLGFMAFGTVSEGVAGREPNRVLALVPLGATPAEVEAVFGRPPEYVVVYGSSDGKTVSHNWTVEGHRLEVTFDNGRSEARHLFRARPGPALEFFARLFFWWLPVDQHGRREAEIVADGGAAYNIGAAVSKQRKVAPSL